MELNPEHVVRQVMSIHGVHNYRPADLLTAVDFLTGEGSSYPFGELVSATYPLSRINEAIDYAQQAKPIRTAIVP